MTLLEVNKLFPLFSSNPICEKPTDCSSDKQ